MNFPLRELISGRGFDRYQGGLRSRFAAFGFRYTLTYGEATDDPAMILNFESALHVGRVTVWESGACDLEALERESGKQVFYEHHEIDSERYFHMVYARLTLFMRNFTDFPIKTVLSPKPPDFRTADTSDAEAVANIYLRSRRTFLPFAPLAHSDADVRAWIRDFLISTGRVTLAQEAGEIIGWMALSQEGDHGWIDQLYLAPGATGRGVGSVFVARAKAELLPLPIRLYTFQENAPARRFYERHGFVSMALGDGSDNEEKCPDVLYECRGW